VKLHKQNILLLILIIVSSIYAYGDVNDLQTIKHISKLFITPIITVYYFVSTKRVNKVFLLALFFIYCENLFAINANEQLFILAMGCALLFILLNMIIVAEKIGRIKLFKLLKILIPIVLVLLTVLYVIFKNGSEITWLFYVLGIIIAIYSSFSVYLYTKDHSKGSSLNLIGVLSFILASIVKGTERIGGTITVFKILNVVFYVSSLFFITRAYISFDSEKQ